jgi:hypothetical protein
LSSFGARQ